MRQKAGSYRETLGSRGGCLEEGSRYRSPSPLPSPFYQAQLSRLTTYYSEHALEWIMENLVDDGDELVAARVIDWDQDRTFPP